MTRTEAEALLARVESILSRVDAEAQEAHSDAGGSLQGWDNLINVEIGSCVVLEQEGVRIKFACDDTDEEIESELRDCFPVLDIDFADAE